MHSPIRSQYLQIKQQYPDALLFFRLGDFYEMFDEDAQIASRELEITLTKRDFGRGEYSPMAGVPFHAADSYIARLVNKGYRVAICEQLSDPALSKGLVTRDVVRVVTPGTVVDPTMLAAKRNNFLAAAVIGRDAVGISYVDITTGEFATTQITTSEPEITLQQEISRVGPAELLVEANPHQTLSQIRTQVQDETTGTITEHDEYLPTWSAQILGLVKHITPYERRCFDEEHARQRLLEHFEVASLEAFGCNHLSQAVRAAGAILAYLEETQKNLLSQLASLETYNTAQFMNLDLHTRRNLELFESGRSGNAKGSLSAVLDHTRTAMGGRLLARWISEPLLHVEHLNKRLDMVEAARNDVELQSRLSHILEKVSDIERLTNRILQRIATPRDLIGLAHGLREAERAYQLAGGSSTSEIVIKEFAGRTARTSTLNSEGSSSSDIPSTDFNHTGSNTSPLNESSLLAKLREIDPCPDISEMIEKAIVSDPPISVADGGVIRAGFSPELDEINNASKHARQWVADLERKERERTGINSLKVGYNKVFGYYIEISHANAGKVPDDYIRKQTLTGGERFITPDLKEYETLILNAHEKSSKIEQEIFAQIRIDIANQAAERLLKTARILAEIDVYLSLGYIAARNNYIRPSLTTDNHIHITGGRHPVVEQTVKDTPFVPNDTELSNEDTQIAVLTGPNMAGKSTYLRQVALITLMAQIGSFVPAETATIGIVDRIFTRIGAQDDLATGQSTFMVEMVETANILHHATPQSLVILDEIGRGTSTYDGLAIARAIIEYLHNNKRCGAKTLFATHYHELVEVANVLPRVKCFNIAVTESEGHVVFLRKIVPGGADKSYGIHVAQLAGIPRQVLHRAEEILGELEQKGEATQRRKVMKEMQLPSAIQLTLFSSEPNPVLEDIKKLHIEEMSPLEAISKLYEYQQKISQMN